jgi:hypothetical protein
LDEPWRRKYSENHDFRPGEAMSPAKTTHQIKVLQVKFATRADQWNFSHSSTNFGALTIE